MSKLDFFCFRNKGLKMNNSNWIGQILHAWWEIGCDLLNQILDEKERKREAKE